MIGNVALNAVMSLGKSVTHRRLIQALGCWLILAQPVGAQSVEAQSETVTAADLIHDLQEGDLQAKREAAWSLAELGPDAAAAVPLLAEAAAERDPQLANGALQALARIGPAATAALPEIRAQLRRGDAQRRYRAAFALGSIAAPDDPDVASDLRDDAAPVRAATAEAIGWMGPKAAPLGPELVRLLDDPDADVGRAAVESLCKIGRPAIPAIQSALADDSTLASVRAAETLGEIGADASDALPALLALAQANHTALRAKVLVALARIAPSRPEVAEQISRGLADDDVDIRRAALSAVVLAPPLAADETPRLVPFLDDSSEIANLAAIALGRAGAAAVPAIPELLSRLTPQNEAAVINTISRIGPAAIEPVLQSVARNGMRPEQAAALLSGLGVRAVPQLENMLQSQEELQRAIACLSLGSLNRDASLLAACLRDDSELVRASAAEGLGRIGPSAKSAAESLNSLMQDADANVRRAALAALLAIGVPTDELLSPTLAGLSDSASEVRREAARALGELPQIPPAAVEALQQALRDPDAAVRAGAATALGKAGRAAQPAVPALIELTHDPSNRVVEEAARAIAKIPDPSPDVIDALGRLLSSPSKALRWAAIQSSGEIGARAESLSTQLGQLRQDPDVDLRLAAITALAQILPEPRQRIDVLLAALDDEDWTIRREVLQVLGGFGGDARDAVPRLLEQMTRQGEDREAVMDALRRIDDAPAEAVPQLIEMLQNSEADRRHRYYALHLLRKIGPAARDSLPILRDLRDAAEGRLQEFYDRAIRDISE